MSTTTEGATAPASPKSAINSEYLRLQVQKIVADVRLEAATEDRQKAARAEAEEPKLRASREFGEARESQDRRPERRRRGFGRA